MTDTDKLIESVADAVLDDLGNRKSFRHVIDNLDGDILADIIDCVGRAATLAVLRGIREPNRGMLASSAQKAGLGPVGSTEVWQAMIDTITREIENG